MISISLTTPAIPGQSPNTTGRNMLSPLQRMQAGRMPSRDGVGVMAALLALPAAAPVASDDANSLLCGCALLSCDDTCFEVLARCGEPASRVLVSGAAGADSPLSEQWLYDGGSQRFPRVLTFRGTRLVRIEVIDAR